MEFGSIAAVLVYREEHRTIDTAAELGRLTCRQEAANRGSADDALTVLIGAGEIESAVCDALFADCDGVDERASALRSVSIAAARQYLESLRGEPGATPLSGALDALRRMALPPRIELRPSEGYAFYALFPETFAASARKAAEDLKPLRACVIGIRSIGTSLSAVAAAELQRFIEVSSCCVRPRGHPFDRRIAAHPRLKEEWQRELRLGAHFIVVDEGPGLSGSSFASVVRALHVVGVPADRIALLASWDPAPERLLSQDARSVWAAHRRYVTTAAECGITPEKAFGADTSGVDWSAGRWRSHVSLRAGSWPAVQPQHERWKTWVSKEGRILKFAGLGDYGTAAFDRAQQVAEGGMTQPAARLRRGFIELTFIEGEVAAPPFSIDEADTVGRYIGVRAGAPAHDGRSDAAELVEMIRTNIFELLGEEPPPQMLLHLDGLFLDAPVSDIDGRMLPHEWIRRRDQLVKVDAFDHCCDHFFPGRQNAAWDLAAASLELQLSDEGVRRMLEGYKRASGDGRAGDRFCAYRLAYAAFRAGYASMAMEATAGTADAGRFAVVLARAREALQRLIPSVL